MMETSRFPYILNFLIDFFGIYTHKKKKGPKVGKGTVGNVKKELGRQKSWSIISFLFFFFSICGPHSNPVRTPNFCFLGRILLQHLFFCLLVCFLLSLFSHSLSLAESRDFLILCSHSLFFSH